MYTCEEILYKLKSMKFPCQALPVDLVKLSLVKGLLLCRLLLCCLLCSLIHSFAHVFFLPDIIAPILLGFCPVSGLVVDVRIDPTYCPNLTLNI